MRWPDQRTSQSQAFRRYAHVEIGRCAVALLLAVVAGAQTTGIYTASIAPKEGETLTAPCRYELTLPARNVATRAVLAVFDRGQETRAFYDDESLFEFAANHRLGLLWARHCPASDTGEIDAAPANGIGRAMLSALDDFAQSSKHGELATAKLILVGVAQAGPLAAAMPAFAADRVLAGIVYAPLGVAGLKLAPQHAGIPQLIIANGADPVAGTREPYEYFERHFANGAPWAFAVQNGAPHDGALSSTKALMLEWLDMLLTTVPDTTAPVSMGSVQRTGWWLYIQLQDTALRDASNRPVSRAKDARAEKVGQPAPSSYVPAGWMPTKKAAAEWQSFVRRQSHASDAKY